MKKQGLKIALTMVAIILFVLVVRRLQKPLQEEGTITIVVIDENHNEVVHQNIELEKSKTFEELLKTHFDVRIENGMLIEIEGVKADNRDYFIKIFVNGEAANYGVKQLAPKDKDLVTFAYTKVGEGQ